MYWSYDYQTSPGVFKLAHVPKKKGVSRICLGVGKNWHYFVRKGEDCTWSANPIGKILVEIDLTIAFKLWQCWQGGHMKKVAKPWSIVHVLIWNKNDKKILLTYTVQCTVITLGLMLIILEHYKLIFSDKLSGSYTILIRKGYVHFELSKSSSGAVLHGKIRASFRKFCF